ncbi:LysR family transcriptional regulator (plasmid) [Mesorhizobium sp. ISC25]|uniref:LysR family transcriptional regulator n=1 Tax=Mesorhizobium sp. ISC25 TaxID=3077335 RepID=UPI0035DBD1E7
MDRFASITAFVRVAESGGFSAAGRRLNRSKATISDQVQALENAVGVRLLNRTTRRISLTEIGRDYYERCVQILQDLQEADEAAGALQAIPRGQLRVYCHQSIARFVAPVVTDFLTSHSEASVDIRFGYGMIDLVQEAFDLGISPLSPPDATLVGRRLGSLSPIVCGAPAYLEKHPAPQSPADLADHNCLRHPYAPPSPDEWHFLDTADNPVVVRVSGNLITSNLETMRAAAASGIGLVLTVPFLIADLLASGALVPLLPDYRARGFDVKALYPHRRHLSAKVRVFIDMLVDRLAEQERWLQRGAG